MASEPDKVRPIQSTCLFKIASSPLAAASQFLLASTWRAGQAFGEAQDGEYHVMGVWQKEDIRVQERYREGLMGRNLTG
jgi:hypothetical protein